MPIPVDRVEVQRLLADGAQLVEVLPQPEFEEEHLPGAISIPLKTLDAETTLRLERERPVIVYCHDYHRDMSPRAAWRLESIGFPQVYDYVAGKADWGSFGLPLEGTKGTRAGEHVRADVPTCRLEERLQVVRRSVSAAGWDTCIVVNEHRVVLGRLGRRSLASDVDVTVEAAMTAGPSTVRPSITLAAITERIQRQKLTSALVTRSDGTLVGVLRRADAEAALSAPATEPSESSKGREGR